MSRRIILNKKIFKKDLKYNNLLIYILINKVLKCGKYFIAKKIVYKSLNYIYNKTNKNPIIIFEEAVKNVSPNFILKKTFNNDIEMPMELNIFNSTNIGISWIIESSKKNTSNIYFFKKLGEEILNSYNGTSLSIKKKEQINNIIKSNQQYIINDDDDYDNYANYYNDDDYYNNHPYYNNNDYDDI